MTGRLPFPDAGHHPLSPGNSSDPSTSQWSAMLDMASRSTRLFVKKLSRNDTSWADDPRKHQAGFYVPREIRTSGFFPELHAEVPEKPHIFRSACITLWPQTGELTESKLSHYSNKGPEAHFTVVPRDLFQGLSPASLLVGGHLREPIGGANYWFVVADAGSEEAELLETALDLDSQFHYSLFESDDLRRSGELPKDELAELIDRVRYALKSGTLEACLAEFSTLPSPSALAANAQRIWMDERDCGSLNPFDMDAPGDALMQISRDIEYRLFKRHELRRRAVETISVLSKHSDLTSGVVRGFAELDAIFLSASQQRKTRAGRSFEFHIATMLRDGRIRYAEQAVTGGRRPDFVLPDVRTFRLGNTRTYDEALVLSAKTTLRERWKQVSREGFNCAVFLATVDDRVPDAAIREMSCDGICLVVPEALKKSKEACYASRDNVISFRSFFREEIRSKRPALLLTV